MKPFLTFLFVCSFLVHSSICYADSVKLRLGAGAGIGVLVAGEKRVTGGLSLSPSVLIGLKLKPWLGVSYQNLPNFNTFKTITYLGILDENSFMITLVPSEYVLFDVGPSLDLFSLTLCNNDNWCARQTGMTGGAHARLAVIGKFMSVGLGVVANLHWSHIPSRLYTGPVVTSNVGPVWEW